ncbi:hypothetical protein [Micromonospora endolithica]|uniref:Uncharacterized protein n=1 Tax=Micromonospora endolithica TaxID=230091 RepID=A0A3A9ZTN6_9ACTN|nr:hypothetical protein [Micromonospora endolithica]RKN50946.1 hypothetical protein D7223_04185 [Micromonospora endolithica]TWJ20275.1 hypothetical protein JD76_00373 [Micromonospora endolithica]
MGTDEFSVRGGIRVVPKLGGGVRAEAGWPMARLRADRQSIRLRELWAGTLVISADNLIAIRLRRSTGLEFEVTDYDELWIFRSLSVDRVIGRLAALGWYAEL